MILPPLPTSSLVGDKKTDHLLFDAGPGDEDAMETESRQSHWQNVYTNKSENEVSWFQQSPALSLALIGHVAYVIWWLARHAN